MAFKVKKDEVSLSFHSLKRERLDDDKENVSVPFTQTEFNALLAKLKKLKNLDLDVPINNARVVTRHLAPIIDVEQPHERLICGVYEGSYSGHSYKNTKRGVIPADSISLRPFFFLLYLSEAGKIYIASQYLGTYGGYTAIKHTIIDAIDDNKGIISTSFNSTSIELKDLRAKEIEIAYAKSPQKITGKNDFGRRGAISLKKHEKDDEFEEFVAKSVLNKAKNAPQLRKAIAQILKERNIIELEDDEIEGCKIIAQLDKKRRGTFQLFDESSFATRFPVKVPLKPNGHPEYKQLKEEAIRILKEQIIAKLGK